MQSLIWTVLGTVALAGLLVLILLLMSLVETQGHVALSSDKVVEFHALFDDTPDISAEALAEGWDATPADAGLRDVAWGLRSRPIGRLAAWVCRRSHQFYQTESSFLTLLVAGLLLALLTAWCNGQARRAAGQCASHTGRQLRESLHRHSLRMGTSDLFDRQVSDVVKLFTVEVESVQQWIKAFISRSFQVPLQLLVVVLIGCLIDFSFLVECGVPLIACWLFVLRRRIRHREKVRLELDRASTGLKLTTESIDRSRLIRGFLLDAFEHVRFERHLERYEARLAAVENLNRQLMLLTTAAGLAGLGVVVYIAGGRTLVETESSLSLAEAAFLCGLLLLATVPLTCLVGLISLRDSARTSIDQIYRYLNTIPAVGQSVGATFLQPLEKCVEFHAVAFTDGKRKLLDGVSLKIPAGGITSVVAFDRAEAVALVALLPRFIDPSEGHVTIDGHEIDRATLESLRSEVLWAGGQNSWFTGSVVENIGGGDERFSLSQITEAAKRIHAHNFIQKLAQGYETIVGEHGEQLSESQGFRLALARALLRDPALLVIEEPGDVESPDEKALLEDASRNAAKGRTVIVLPERLRTLKSSDRIVLLNRGRVEVVGTHEALLQTSSLYRHWEYLHFNEFRRDVSPAE